MVKLLLLLLSLSLASFGHIRKHYVLPGASGTPVCNEVTNECTGYSHTMAGLMAAAEAAATHQGNSAACQVQMVIVKGELSGSFVYPAKSQEYDPATGARKPEAQICRQMVYIVSESLPNLATGISPGSADAANLVTLTGTDPTLAVISNSNTETAYWHWSGFQVRPPDPTLANHGPLIMMGNVSDNYTRLPHHITYERFWVHGYPGHAGPRIGFYLVGHDISIVDTRIEEIHTAATAGSESQGILIGSGYNFDVRNVSISAASQNFFTVGASIKPYVNQNITLTGVHMWRPYDWKITASTSDVQAGEPCNFPNSWHRNTSSQKNWQCQGPEGSSVWALHSTGAFPGPNYIIKPTWEIKVTRNLRATALVMDRGWVPNNPIVGAWDGQAHNFVLTNQSSSPSGTTCAQQDQLHKHRRYTRADFVTLEYSRGDRGHSAINMSSSVPPMATCGYTESGWAINASHYKLRHNLWTNMNPPDPSNGVSSTIGGRLTGWNFGGHHRVENQTLTLAPGSAAGQVVSLSSTFPLDNPVTLRNNLISIGSSNFTGNNFAVSNGARQLCLGNKGIANHYSYLVSGNVFTRETSTLISVHSDPCGMGLRMFPGNTIQTPTSGTAAPQSWQAFLDNDYRPKSTAPKGDDNLPVGANVDLVTWHTDRVKEGDASRNNHYLYRFSIDAIGAGRGLYIVKPTKDPATIIVDDSADYSSPVYSAVDAGTSTEVVLDAATLGLGSVPKQFRVKVILADGKYKESDYFNF